MSLELILILRLIMAGLFGALIGIEREYRAKEAGIRTHFFVCIGSALFMIASQYGFTDGLRTLLAEYPDLPIRADTSRVASQIVSGIGFIGAGTIILQKRFVIGLTTAAGLWTTAAIGVAVGGGLYILAFAATLMTFFAFESLRTLSFRMGHLRKEIKVVFLADNDEIAQQIIEHFRIGSSKIGTYLAIRDKERVRISISIDVPQNSTDADTVLSFLLEQPGVTVESVEV